jgi:hypothetical protein
MSLTDFIAYTSLIISAVALWRAREVKHLDLRIELQKSFNDLDVVVSGIEEYLDFVCESHLRVMAAIGQLRSGAEKVFKSEFGADKEKLHELLNSQPKRKSDYRRSSQSELESEIVAVHSCRIQIAGLRAKYQEIFGSDEERRKEIRAQHQHRS